MLIKRNTSHGFSLLELLVTLAVAAILVSLAVPAVGQYLGRAQRDRDVNELRTELILARTEAIRRGSNVGVCASSTLSSCGDNWSLGWIVYVDSNHDGSLTAGEEVIRRHQPSISGLTLTASVTDITFFARGGTPDAGGILFSSAQQDTNQKLIRIDAVGQPRICTPQAGTMLCEVVE